MSSPPGHQASEAFELSSPTLYMASSYPCARTPPSKQQICISQPPIRPPMQHDPRSGRILQKLQEQYCSVFRLDDGAYPQTVPNDAMRV